MWRLRALDLFGSRQECSSKDIVLTIGVCRLAAQSFHGIIQDWYAGLDSICGCVLNYSKGP